MLYLVEAQSSGQHSIDLDQDRCTNAHFRFESGATLASRSACLLAAGKPTWVVTMFDIR